MKKRKPKDKSLFFDIGVVGNHILPPDPIVFVSHD